MRHPLPAVAVLAVLVPLFSGCPTPAKPSETGPVSQSLLVPAVPSATLAGGQSVRWGLSSDTDLTKTRSVTVTLTAAPAETVYFLLTNTSPAPTSAPVVGAFSGSGKDLGSGEGDAVLRPPTPEGPAVRMNPPQRPLPPLKTRSGARALAASPASPTLNQPLVFKDLGPEPPYPLILTPVHLRLRTAVIAGRTLNLWVADDCWDADGNGTLEASDPQDSTPWTPPSRFVTQTMLDQLADRFLKDGTNDLYGWVTRLLGAEWYDPGTVPAPYQGLFIDGNGDLHIFIKNLNPGTGGRIVWGGSFYSGNNFRSDYDAYFADSNERLLFTLDAASLAGDLNEATSILAHEFQHMVHFYQKTVRNGLSDYSDTWINEMASMMVEDLVAEKLPVPGPRGVPLNNDGTFVYSTGDPGILDGRFPDFNLVHDLASLTGWGTSINNSPLDSYATAYAFGAWLLRNYGGPDLLADLVTSPYLDTEAVVRAVNARGPATPQTFATLVRDWGLAVFLGDAEVRPGLNYAHYDAGTPTAFVWAASGTRPQYRAGSIDLYHYRTPYSTTGGRAVLEGPWIYQGAPPKFGLYAGATSFVKVGPGTGGSQSWTVTLPPGIALTAVVR